MNIGTIELPRHPAIDGSIESLLDFARDITAQAVALTGFNF